MIMGGVIEFDNGGYHSGIPFLAWESPTPVLQLVICLHLGRAVPRKKAFRSHIRPLTFFLSPKLPREKHHIFRPVGCNLGVRFPFLFFQFAPPCTQHLLRLSLLFALGIFRFAPIGCAQQVAAFSPPSGEKVTTRRTLFALCH